MYGGTITALASSNRPRVARWVKALDPLIVMPFWTGPDTVNVVDDGRHGLTIDNDDFVMKDAGLCLRGDTTDSEPVRGVCPAHWLPTRYGYTWIWQGYIAGGIGGYPKLFQVMNGDGTGFPSPRVGLNFDNSRNAIVAATNGLTGPASGSIFSLSANPNNLKTVVIVADPNGTFRWYENGILISTTGSVTPSMPSFGSGDWLKIGGGGGGVDTHTLQAAWLNDAIGHSEAVALHNNPGLLYENWSYHRFALAPSGDPSISSAKTETFFTQDANLDSGAAISSAKTLDFTAQSATLGNLGGFNASSEGGEIDQVAMLSVGSGAFAQVSAAQTIANPSQSTLLGPIHALTQSRQVGTFTQSSFIVNGDGVYSNSTVNSIGSQTAILAPQSGLTTLIELSFFSQALGIDSGVPPTPQPPPTTIPASQVIYIRPAAHLPGNPVRIRVVVRNWTGMLTDATDVLIKVSKPSGATTTYTYQSLTVTRQSLGRYYVDVTPGVTEFGQWRVRIETTGTAALAAERAFYVKKSVYS